MLRFLPAPIKGVFASLFMSLNTLFWCIPLFMLAIIKFLLPIAPVQKLLRYLMHEVASAWIVGNSVWMHAVQKIRWDVKGLPEKDMKNSFFVTSNHQSWVDILALQHLFNRRIPMLKFFLKKELIWVPVMGLCWWALEFPFMQRYTKEFLKKHPEMRGKDMETTRKACERYKTNPVSVFNFLEGTRFTKEKHDRQKSPYHYLLKPKTGGAAFVLDAMGGQLKSIMNTTIVYPEGIPTLWDLLCGKVKKIVVRVDEIEIPKQFLGKDYEQDEQYRIEFQRWINDLWKRKDELLTELNKAA